MKAWPEVPSEALPVQGNSNGLSLVDLHARGGRFYHETSRAPWRFFLTLAIIAALVLMLPWEARAEMLDLKLKYLVAAILLWGGLAVVLASVVRSVFGTNIVFEPATGLATFRKYPERFSVPLSAFLGWQICPVKVRADPELNGFQCNLIWREENGRIRRHCLTQHGDKGTALRLGQRYEALLHWPGREEPETVFEKA